MYSYLHENPSSASTALRPPPGTDDLIAHSTGAFRVALGVNMSAVAVPGRVLTHEYPKELEFNPNDEPQEVILNMGIIDILQQYTASKNLETKFMGILHKSKSFSSIDPHSYAKRFLKFMNKVFE
jgi:1-phosphatidylinositol-4-phosphate 5-kinase